MHALNVLEDVLGDEAAGKAGELADAMAAAGCVGINFTGDSASAAMLESYNQPHRADDLERGGERQVARRAAGRRPLDADRLGRPRLRHQLLHGALRRRCHRPVRPRARGHH